MIRGIRIADTGPFYFEQLYRDFFLRKCNAGVIINNKMLLRR